MSPWNYLTAKLGGFRLLVITLLVLTCMPVAQALQVTGLYSYRVAVANESEAERVRAFGEALAAVIVKVTGTRRWLEDPAVARALNNAQSYVEAISYSSETVSLPPPEEPAEPQVTAAGDTDQVSATPAPVVTAPPRPTTREQRYVNVTFAASLINELLTNANVPIWDSNRPSVLVWMVLQDVSGDRRLLTVDRDPEIIELIQRFGVERGVPLIFPVLDFEDRRNLPVESLWNLDEAAISAASVRYGADTVLAGRLLFTASSELVGLWQFIFQNEATVFDGFESDLQAYLYNPLDRITNQLANYFAIVPVATDQRYVRLRVDGIDDLNAYSGLLNYVRNLGLVRSVTPAQLDGERLELELGLQGDAQQLLELIALDRDLLPISAAMDRLPGAPAGAISNPSILHYRWTR